MKRVVSKTHGSNLTKETLHPPKYLTGSPCMKWLKLLLNPFKPHYILLCT